jgi:hypothetical protein
MKPGPKPRPKVACLCGRLKPENGTCGYCWKVAARRAAGVKPRGAALTAREISARWNYGISPEDLRALDQKQAGACAICRRPPSGQRGLHVDHDHRTGTVRGLLCHGCNTGLGSFRDDPELIVAALSYLQPTV